MSLGKIKRMGEQNKRSIQRPPSEISRTSDVENEPKLNNALAALLREGERKWWDNRHFVEAIKIVTKVEAWLANPKLNEGHEANRSGDGIGKLWEQQVASMKTILGIQEHIFKGKSAKDGIEVADKQFLFLNRHIDRLKKKLDVFLTAKIKSLKQAKKDQED